MTPLNSENYLVEAGLTLHTLNKSNSSLVVVGFMKKRDTKDEGIIMIEHSSGEVLAINSKFAAQMKNKVTGKQIIQEELKLAAILPEVDLTLIGKEECQNSLLEIGHLTEEEMLEN